MRGIFTNKEMQLINASFIVFGLSCSDVKEAGTGATFTLDDLETLKEEDFQTCLVFLGKDPLGEKEGKYLWEALIQVGSKIIILKISSPAFNHLYLFRFIKECQEYLKANLDN